MLEGGLNKGCKLNFVMTFSSLKKLDINQLISIFHKTNEMNYFKIRHIRYSLLSI